jgi:hypothetical protein
MTVKDLRKLLDACPQDWPARMEVFDDMNGRYTVQVKELSSEDGAIVLIQGWA